MDKNQFGAFAEFRTWLKNYCDELNGRFGGALKPLQKAAAAADTPPYEIETPVVYNSALDEIGEESEIRLIVIGDNPGKDEQRAENRKYLVGMSGKIASGFFGRNPEFQVDFRKNVLILNKTPVHTAKTKHLRFLSKSDEKIANLIEESQVKMAQKTAELHRRLASSGVELWLVGYAEMKGRGVFLKYRDALEKSYGNDSGAWERVRVFQHFSMNRFSIDLALFQKERGIDSVTSACSELGKIHREEIFG